MCHGFQHGAMLGVAAYHGGLMCPGINGSAVHASWLYPPTLLSLQAIAFARLLLLMDPSMGPRWREMAMQGQDIWRANAPLGWGDCSWQSIAAYSTCSPPMASTMELYWELQSIVGANVPWY